MNQYLLAFIETKHDTMCFNLATPLLNLELYIVFEYRHYAKKSNHPRKKVQKALQPIKKKASHRKKSTTVLLKALATIPVRMKFKKWNNAQVYASVRCRLLFFFTILKLSCTAFLIVCSTDNVTAKMSVFLWTWNHRPFQ